MNGLETQFRIAEIEINQSSLDEKIIGVFRYESEGKASRGPIVLILAEIFSNLYVYEQLLDVINETAERTRHLTIGVDADPMARFEKLIQKLNEAVTKFLQDEPTPITWNRVNIFVLELSDGHVSLSGIGRLTNVFLQKQSDGTYRSFDLLGSLEQPGAIQPQKPFASLICGDVSPGDLLFVGTQNFERLRNEIQLVERLKGAPPVSAALEIKQLVEEQRIPDDYAGLVIAHIVLPSQTIPGKAKQREISKHKSTESVEKMHHEVQKTQAILSPALPPLAAPIQHDRPPLHTIVKTYVRQQTRHFLNWLKQLREKAPVLKDPVSLASLRGMNAGHGAFMTPQRKKTIVGIGCIILLLIMGIIWFKHAKRASAEQALWTAVFDQVYDRKTRAEADLVYGNEDRAQGYVKEARTLLASLNEQTPQRKKSKADLETSLHELETKLRREIRIEHPTQLLSGVGEDAARLVTVHKNMVFAVSPDGSSLIQIDPTNNVKTRLKLPSTSTTAIGITPTTQGVTILLQPPGLIHVNTDTLLATVIPFELTNASSSQAIASYNRRIYSLDAQKNMVWKYSASGNGFGKESAYLKQTSIDLKDAVALTIDANIYIGKQNGTVVRYLSGAEESWNLHSIDPPLTSLSALWTDPDTDRIVIADLLQKRLLVFRKDGQLIAQITSPDFHAPQALFGSSSNKKLYVVDQQQLFMIDLP